MNSFEQHLLRALFSYGNATPSSYTNATSFLGSQSRVAPEFSFTQHTQRSRELCEPYRKDLQVIDFISDFCEDENLPRASNLHIAARSGDFTKVEEILKGGCNVNAKTSDGNFTPLHFAAISKHEKIVDILIKNGADLNVDGAQGFTPLNGAAQQVNSLTVIKMLVENGANVQTVSDMGNTPLHFAAGNGDLDTVNYLIDKGADVNASDAYHVTPLMHSIFQGGHAEVVKALISNNASVNVKCSALDVRGVLDASLTPLHFAAQHGHEDIVQILIEAGANVNAKTRDKITPLHLASQSGYVETVNALLKANCDVNCKDYENATALHLASDKGHHGVVQALLKVKGIHINSKSSVMKSTPLHLASEKGHFATVKLLVENNARLTDVTEELFTPLHLALQQSHFEVSEYLIQNGASVTARDDKRWTPLHNVCHMQMRPSAKDDQIAMTNIAKALITKGADINAKEADGKTALHFVAEHNYIDILKFLVAKGADVNAVDNRKWTPLHYAAYDGNLDAVECLVRKVSNINARSLKLTTPLHFAVDHGYFEVAESLLKNGADVNARDHTNWTPLHFAAEKGYDKMSELLLKYNADLSLREDQNGTPLHSAAQYKHPSLVKLFVQHGADVNAKMDADATPLHLAAQAGSIEIVRTLLSNGANFHATTNARGNSATPLEFAMIFRHSKVISLLQETELLFSSLMKNDRYKVKSAIESGACIDATDANGKSPLHYAISNCDIDTVNILLKEEVDITKVTSKGNTPLHIAIAAGENKIFEVILRYAVEKLSPVQFNDFINAKTTAGGTTVIHIAAEKNNVYVVKLLLEHGAVYNAINNHKKVPLQLTTNNSIKVILHSVEQIFEAAKKTADEVKVAQLLVTEPLILNARDNEGGGTPLYWACSKGHSGIAKCLLNHDADYSAVTNKGSTPLHIASLKGNVEIVEILLNKVKSCAFGELDAFVNTQTIVGSSALHVAATLEVTKSLLRHGAVYCIRNNEGKTPSEVARKEVRTFLDFIDTLFEGANNGDPEVIHKLQDRSVDDVAAIIHARNDRKQTLTQVAVANGHKELAFGVLNLLKTK